MSLRNQSVRVRPSSSNLSSNGELSSSAASGVLYSGRSSTSDSALSSAVANEIAMSPRGRGPGLGDFRLASAQENALLALGTNYVFVDALIDDGRTEFSELEVQNMIDFESSLRKCATEEVEAGEFFMAPCFLIGNPDDNHALTWLSGPLMYFQLAQSSRPRGSLYARLVTVSESPTVQAVIDPSIGGTAIRFTARPDRLVIVTGLLAEDIRKNFVLSDSSKRALSVEPSVRNVVARVEGATESRGESGSGDEEDLDTGLSIKKLGGVRDLDGRGWPTVKTAEGHTNMKTLGGLLRLWQEDRIQVFIHLLTFSIERYQLEVRRRFSVGQLHGFSPAMLSYQQLGLVLHLPVQHSQSLLKRFILGDWRADDWAHLSLVHFVPEPSRQPWGDQPTFEGRHSLLLALDGLERMMTIHFYEGYEGTFVEVRRLLVSGLDNSATKASDVYLRFQLERLVSTFFWDVFHTHGRSLACPDADLSTAAGCVQLWCAYTRRFVDQVPQWESFPHGYWSSPMGEFKRVILDNASGKTSLKPANPVARDALCLFFLGESLKVVGHKGDVISCTRKPCPLGHNALSTVTRAQALSACKPGPNAKPDSLRSLIHAAALKYDGFVDK